MSPRSALPPHLDEAKEWRSTDDDQVWWMRWRKHVKGFFAFSSRSPEGITWTLIPFLLVPIWFVYSLFKPLHFHWWYLFPIIPFPVTKKWRELPITLFSFSGQGILRLENSKGTSEAYHPTGFYFLSKWGMMEESSPVESYLSRVQYYCRYHFQFQWPFFIAFHFYPKIEDVRIPNKVSETDGKIWFFYFGWHRDADNIFWGPSAYLGRNFK